MSILAVEWTTCCTWQRSSGVPDTHQLRPQSPRAFTVSGIEMSCILGADQKECSLWERDWTLTWPISFPDLDVARSLAKGNAASQNEIVTWLVDVPLIQKYAGRQWLASLQSSRLQNGWKSSLISLQNSESCLRVCRSSGLQVCRSAGLQVCRSASLHVCMSAVCMCCTPIARFSSRQLKKLFSLRKCTILIALQQPIPTNVLFSYLRTTVVIKPDHVDRQSSCSE